MKKILTIALVALLMNNVASARAEDAMTSIPDFKSCPKLTNEDSYGDDYSSVKMMMQGKNGFVFRTRHDLYADFTISDKGIALFQALTAALEKKGTTLVVAILPTRGIIASEFLPDSDPLLENYNPKEARAAYAALIAKMNGYGINAVGDARIQSGEKYYYKADQHWTSFGASQMAQMIAAQIKKHPVYNSIAKTAFKTSTLEKTSFEGTFNASLEPLCGFKMPMEHDTLAKTEPVEKGGSEEDLFGEKSDPEIVLVGTSNSKKNIDDLNFDGYLKEFLSADVYNAAVSGGGFDDSLIGYLTSEKFRARPPKILIWEIPGYYSLDKEDARDVLQQAISAAHGKCENPIVVSNEMIPNAEIIKVIDNLAEKNINSNDIYAQVEWSAPIKKNFSTVFERADGKSQSINFKPSKRIANEGIFFFAPFNNAKSPLSAVTLKTPKELHELSVKVTLCPIPQRIVVPETK